MLNNCIREDCRFYDSLCEFAIDGCMYGASVEDKERERLLDNEWI